MIWPKKNVEKANSDEAIAYDNGWNAAIDACRAAYAEHEKNKWFRAVGEITGDAESGLEGGQQSNDYAMGWWNAMSACRDYGIETAKAVNTQGQGLDRAIIGIDREAAEQIANEIWEQCATKGAIADYIQARFPPYTIPVSEPDIQKPALKPLDEYQIKNIILWQLNNFKGVDFEFYASNSAKTICEKYGVVSPRARISVEEIAEIIYNQCSWKESPTYVSDFGALHQDTQDRFLKIAKEIIQALTKDTK